jgi:hypothetical protein
VICNPVTFDRSLPPLCFVIIIAVYRWSCGILDLAVGDGSVALGSS